MQGFVKSMAFTKASCFIHDVGSHQRERRINVKSLSLCARAESFRNTPTFSKEDSRGGMGDLQLPTRRDVGDRGVIYTDEEC